MRNRKFKSVVSAFVIVMMLAMFVGCGNSDSETPATESNGDAAAEASETGTDESGEALGEEVTMILGYDTSTLDFHIGHSGGLKYAFSTIYEPLAIRDQRGDEELTLICAETFEHVDDCKYQIKIWDNIYDTDGNHITTEDVQWIYDTCMEITNYGNFLSAYDHIEIIDEYSFYLYVTSEQLGSIENILSGVPIISKACYEENPDRFVSDPVTTTGYVVTSFQEGYGFSVEYKGDWREEGQAESLTYSKNVKKINYVYITETAQVRMALQNGDADVAYNVATEDLDVFRQTDGFAVNEDIDNRLTQVLFNCSDSAVTSDIHLRKAIAYCINRQEINDFIFGGTAGIPNALCSTNLIDYNPDWVYPYEYDVEAAKEELAQADYSGETIRIIASSSATNKSCATLMISYMEEIGIHAEVTTVEDSIIEATAGEPGNWELYLSPRGSEDYMCNMWIHWADQERFDGATQNFVVDDKLQDLYEQIRDAKTWTQEVSDEAANYNNEMMYVMPLFQAPMYCVYNSDMISSIVLNYKVYPIAPAFTYNY